MEGRVDDSELESLVFEQPLNNIAATARAEILVTIVMSKRLSI
jgi:hypothetical protein